MLIFPIFLVNLLQNIKSGNMEIIQVLDKKFRISIPEEEIFKRVDAVAEQLNRDMAGKNPLFLAVLNGNWLPIKVPFPLER